MSILTGDAVSHNENAMVKAAGITENLPWVGDTTEVKLHKSQQ